MYDIIALNGKLVSELREIADQMKVNHKGLKKQSTLPKNPSVRNPHPNLGKPARVIKRLIQTPNQGIRGVSRANLKTRSPHPRIDLTTKRTTFVREGNGE